MNGDRKDTDSSMQYEWAENNINPPYGVMLLGDSEPESGKEYIMYQATTRQAAQAILTSGFRQSASGILGPGVYLSRDLEKASYPIDRSERNKVVIMVVVKVGKVIPINCKKNQYRTIWRGLGYNTAWVPPGCEGLRSCWEEMCVRDPRQIKILCTIKPKPVQPRPVQPQPVQRCCECGAHGYM